jgi:RHS repeat-associated protein
VLKKNKEILVTTYSAGLYEAKVYSDGTTKEFFYITSGSGIAAVLIKTNADDGELFFLHCDHLGSIVSVTNQSDIVVEEANYDPWGCYRNASTWSLFEAKPLTTITRGFTGHEHLYEFALINMNGRVYDPVLGLFLSPDPYVQAPNNVNNFNRYSYCLNNPLMYTDPSGEFFWLIPAAVGFVTGYLSHGFSTGDWGWSAVGSGAIGAGTALLGFYSGGATSAASIAQGFSAVSGGHAATVALGYSGRYVASAAISSIMPSASINIGDASFSVSPAFMIGSGGASAGLNFQASYNAGDFTFGGAFGTSYGKSGFTGNTGSEIRLSGFAGYDDGNFGIGLSTTQFWSGETSQRLGRLSMRYNDFSMSYENDGTPFQYVGLAGGTDSYRTASVTLGYLDATIGMLLFTGHRDYNAVDYSDLENYPYGMVSNSEINKYNAGILYAGYGNMRAGWNHDNIRHVFQNKGAHGGYPTKQAWIPRKSWPNQPYFVYGANNPYTNW